MTGPAYDDQDVPLVHVVGRSANRHHGHIALGSDGGPALVAFTDLGPELHLWAGTSAGLTPDAAAELGYELIRWADRKRRRVTSRAVERVDVQGGLL